MAATGKSKTCVWRWQERFMAEGVDGLLREKTRPPGTPRTSDEKVGEVIRLTQEPPPHEATHWTIRAMGKAVGLAASTVREIWKAHGLSPHRWRQFKLSNDRAFAEKLHDVVGSTSRRPPMQLCCRWMKRRKYRRLTGPSPACH